MPDNLNFMTKNYTIDKKKRTFHSDWSVSQEDIILNVYVPDNRASKFMKENMTMWEKRQICVGSQNILNLYQY